MVSSFFVLMSVVNRCFKEQKKVEQEEQEAKEALELL